MSILGCGPLELSVVCNVSWLSKQEGWGERMEGGGVEEWRSGEVKEERRSEEVVEK